METKEELSRYYQKILLELPPRPCHDSLEELQQKIQVAVRHSRQKRTKEETLVSELIHLVPLLQDCKKNHRYEAQVAISLPQVLKGCDRLAAMRYQAYQDIDEPDKPSLDDLFRFFYHGQKEILALPPAKAYRTRYIETRILSRVKEAIPASPPAEYPLARGKKRHFILHVGATNTGKTYEALQDLKCAESGIYLAPLRLLAMEVQERLLEEGIFCSLLTGEEEDILRSATVMSATVEKLDVNHEYEVAVIDECQMIADPQRGAAWTRAILGVRAERIHVCMAPEAEHIVKSLISDCKDTCEIVRHRRTIPLKYENKPYHFPDDIREGDALVVFSRKQVLSVAAELRRGGIQASVIYGALPYAARKKQVHRFLTGEAKVLVTTDAIGMGMNLPIRRIVFMDIVKFDGKERRMLGPAETKQIAGRAGRQGMYQEGFVACIEDTDVIADNLDAETEKITQARLNFSEALLKSDYALEDLIRMWSFAQVPDKYSKMDTEEPLTLLRELRTSGVDMSGQEANELLYQMITVGFDIENRDLVDQWLAACLDYLDGAQELEFPDCNVEELLDMETACKELDLYYQMCHRFHLPCDENRVSIEKDRLAAAIDRAIASELQNFRKRCRICGTTLPWDAAFGICTECFDAQKSLRRGSGMTGRRSRSGRNRNSYGGAGDRSQNGGHGVHDSYVSHGGRKRTGRRKH